MSERDPAKIATWLVEKINKTGQLTLKEATGHIKKMFGKEYLVPTGEGSYLLAPAVKESFKKLQGDTIIWDNGHKGWRFIKFPSSRQSARDYVYSGESVTLPQSVEPKPIPPHASLDHYSLYFNHELGWLDFNWRVLFQAMDNRQPLLERIRFLSIASTNLDEFLQKRLGGLKRQEMAGVQELSPDGRTPAEQIALVRQIVRKMQSHMTGVWHEVLQPLLKTEAAIVIENYASVSDDLKKYLDAYFESHIYPILTPMAVDATHPFPFISNLSLSLGIVFNRNGVDNEPEFARIKMPENLPRFIQLEDSSAGFHFIRVEEVVKNNILKIFKGLNIEEVFTFRVTRNADIRREEEEADDLIAMISEELRERRFAPIVRLEIDDNVSDASLHMLVKELGIDYEDVYKVKGMIDFASLKELADLDLPPLKYEKWNPVVQVRLHHDKQRPVSIFDVIKRGDLMVQHPYDSFKASVQQMIEEASSDPDVIAIKLTLYRTSDESPIVKALIRAVERGKQVAVIVEVKARFDEANNIEWGKVMENAGIQVTYGLVGLKTHAKVALVIRNEDEGPRSYCHISTGNYHSKKASIYTDIGLLTCDPVIGEDLTKLFHFLTVRSSRQDYKKLIVSPAAMRQRFYDLINAEIESHNIHGNGHIVAKMNALDDVDIIQLLYKASQQGVEIDLIVRGHSRLRPGVRGISDNIRIISIIGRFLEHDRIYYFHNNGDPKLFIGSADWRFRNLNQRVEAVVPIEQQRLKRRLIFMLKHAMKDNRLAWDLQQDGRYIQRKPVPGKKVRDYHKLLMKDAIKRNSQNRSYSAKSLF